MKCLQVIRPGDLRSQDPDKKGIMEVREVPEPQIASPTEVKIKVVDMPKAPASPDVTYIGPYLQNLQSAAQAYGIDIEMSKEMRKYIENPPPEKKDKKKKK